MSVRMRAYGKLRKGKTPRNTRAVRPAIALERNADAIIELGKQWGITNIFVFGSCVRGEDGPHSDIDLIADVEEGRSYFDIGNFCVTVEEMTGYPVDLVISDNKHNPSWIDTTEKVAL